MSRELRVGVRTARRRQSQDMTRLWLTSVALATFGVGAVGDEAARADCRNCSTPGVRVEAPPDWLEMELLGFRLWMIIGLILAAILVVVIALCCIFDCRIPRTKQEIQMRIEKQQEARKGLQKNEVSERKRPPKNHNTSQPNRRHHGAPHQRATSDRLTNEATPSKSRASHVNENFQLHERPYGRRLRYIPGRGLDLGNSEDATVSRQFHPDPECTANALASLQQQPYSRV